MDAEPVAVLAELDDIFALKKSKKKKNEKHVSHVICCYLTQPPVEKFWLVHFERDRREVCPITFLALFSQNHLRGRLEPQRSFGFVRWIQQFSVLPAASSLTSWFQQEVKEECLRVFKSTCCRVSWSEMKPAESKDGRAVFRLQSKHDGWKFTEGRFVWLRNYFL